MSISSSINSFCTLLPFTLTVSGLNRSLGIVYQPGVLSCCPEGTFSGLSMLLVSATLRQLDGLPVVEFATLSSRSPCTIVVGGGADGPRACAATCGAYSLASMYCCNVSVTVQRSGVPS